MLFALLLPLFLMAGLGALLARPGMLADRWQPGLNALTARLLIPAFLFSGAFKNGIPATVSWQFLAAFFVPLFALFLVAAYGVRRGPGSAPRALSATYSNTVFVGIPVVSQAFGPDSLQFAFPVIAFHGLAAFSLYYLASPGQNIAASLRNAVSNPIVVSLMLGLACNLTGLTLPAPLATVLAMLSGAALPCALLALGASLAGFRILSWGDTLATVFAKLVLLPACVLGMALCVFRLPAPATAVLVVIAACPVGVNAAALVQSDGKNPAQVSSAILLSSIACMATLPLWIWLVRAL
jgi:malonate transporter